MDVDNHKDEEEEEEKQMNSATKNKTNKKGNSGIVLLPFKINYLYVIDVLC
jgi:hypothetical protein